MRIALLACLLAPVLAASRNRPGPVSSLPDWVEVCGRNDPDLNLCIKDKLVKNIRKAKDGISELGVPPLEPFVVREMLVEYRQGDVAGKMLIKNSRTHGLTDVIVGDVRANLDDGGLFRMEVDVGFQQLFLEGDYKAQGKIIVFPINGKGVYNISMADVTATWNVTGEYFRKAGKKFLRLTRFDMFPEVGDMEVYASNLFTGNDEFNKAALAFANEFWPVLYTELLPFANEGWDKVMRNEANKVLARIPFNLLFPDE
ncbi:protein takeout-like [Schistocerca cancellata]|uniref:protein takeout-like n=1 Tax=Schistocerca cancellata TaxID=274614 RepID=UPI0021184BF8|nr:protein takeout-like [Schistocerca cancellata]